MQQAYIVLLALALIATAWRKDGLLIFGISVVFGNWVACMLAVLLTGDKTPAELFLLIDSVSAALVLRRDDVVMRLLGSSYMVQMVAHVYFRAGGLEPYPYWQALTVIAGLQLLLLGAAALWMPPRLQGGLSCRR